MHLYERQINHHKGRNFDTYYPLNKTLTEYIGANGEVRTQSNCQSLPAGNLILKPNFSFYDENSTPPASTFWRNSDTPTNGNKLLESYTI